jgi:hypothetical protein
MLEVHVPCPALLHSFPPKLVRPWNIFVPCSTDAQFLRHTWEPTCALQRINAGAAFTVAAFEGYGVSLHQRSTAVVLSYLNSCAA